VLMQALPPNKALHLTSIPLRCVAAGALRRYVPSWHEAVVHAHFGLPAVSDPVLTGKCDR
jgi:hypothetical protein